MEKNTNPEVVVCPFTGDACEKGCNSHNGFWDILLEKFGYDRETVNAFSSARLGRISEEQKLEFKRSDPKRALLCENLKKGKR